MALSASCIDLGRLKKLLDETLPQEEQEELSQHLETCQRCQKTLEELVAGKDAWCEVARHLAHSPPPAPPADLGKGEGAVGRRQSVGAPFKGAATGNGEAQRAAGFMPDVQDEELSLSFLSPPDKPGQLGRLGHYDVLEVIGRGGMGIVLKAFDQTLHRMTAIKVLAPHLASSATARKRFIREAQATAAVRNDHVIAIYAVEEANVPPYLVMEYIHGLSLQEKLDQKGPLELREILRIGMQIAAGLAAAHAQGLVHRDIKPANILLENGVQRVKITDFGLARAVDDATLTQSGVVVGTPQYMAPEQARGEVADHRADLFSLGSVLYAMCTGWAPFRAATSMAVLKRVCDDTPRSIAQINSDIPDWLAAIIERLHAKDPRERFQSATEVTELLGQHLARLQQPRSESVNQLSVNQFPDSLIHSSRVRARSPDRALSGTVGRPCQNGGRRWIGAAIVVAMLLVGVGVAVPQIVIRIRDKNGKVTEVKVPAGSQVEIEQNGKVVASVPSTTGEIRRFTGHTKAVDSVAFSPDGRQAISVGRDQFVIRWDVDTGRELGRFEHPGVKHGVAYSPKGDCALVTGKTGRVSLYDLKTGKELRRVSEQGGGVLAFSPDGRRALCSSDNVISLRLLETGRELQRLEGHEDTVMGLAFFADGRRAISGSIDRTLRLWDLEAGKELKRLEGHRDGIWGVALSPDNRRVVSAAIDETARLWDVETGKELRAFAHPGTGVMCVSFSPDGRRILTGGGEIDRTLRLWDVETGKELVAFKLGNAVRSVAFSPDGKYALSGSWDMTVRLFRLPEFENKIGR